MRRDKQELMILVLQGGGALGAYQAGAYEALAEAGYVPDWIAGISIGALNAAIIAGNPPERRVARLRTFWERVSSGLVAVPFAPGADARAHFNDASAAIAAFAGIPGFYEPRFPPAILMPSGSAQALSVYDTAPLARTLEELVDFDVLNAGQVRLSAGAVNIGSGNFVYFDTQEMPVAPQHIMASGALPPGFPPVEIEGQFYWDGGLVSNTPLQFVLDDGGPRHDMCIFQVDLFSARGPLPANLMDVQRREKEIRFSSRTRLNTDVAAELQTLRRAARRLYGKLPDHLRDDPDAVFLHERSCDAAITIVHLIYRQASYERQSKDYEFSRLSVQEHWQAGGDDVRHTLRQPAWHHRGKPAKGVNVFDLTRDGGS
jgi:NTE family protein